MQLQKILEDQQMTLFGQPYFVSCIYQLKGRLRFQIWTNFWKNSKRPLSLHENHIALHRCFPSKLLQKWQFKS